MNFLEICKRVRQECGVSGDGPSNVSGQIGMSAKIVDWVKSAHEEIQIKQNNWRFDWATATAPLTAGKEFYSDTELGVSFKNWDFDSIYLYRTAEGPASRTWLTRSEYAEYRHLRTPSVQGRPIYVSWLPDKRLGLYPIPDAGLTMAFDGYLKPQVLVISTDTPRIPSEYHMAIVWRAVMFFCADQENPALHAQASQNYNSLMLKMEVSEIEGPMSSEPLA